MTRRLKKRLMHRPLKLDLAVALVCLVLGLVVLAQHDRRTGMEGNLPADRILSRLHLLSLNSIEDLNASLPSMSSTVDTGVLQVPNVAPAVLPKDIQGLSGSRLKGIFIRSLLPHILFQNSIIAEERKLILSYKDKLEAGVVIPEELAMTMIQLMQKYRVDEKEGAGILESQSVRRLLERADVIPVSLAVAQAALESGWGRSRIALSGNNLFGQFRRVPVGENMAPSEDGTAFTLKTFSHLSEAVERYYLNLNTHPAYNGFRDSRAGLRKAGQELDSILLAHRLKYYSEREEAYILDVVSMIRQNDLRLLDRSMLIEQYGPVRNGKVLTNHLVDLTGEMSKTPLREKTRV